MPRVLHSIGIYYNHGRASIDLALIVGEDQFHHDQMPPSSRPFQLPSLFFIFKSPTDRLARQRIINIHNLYLHIYLDIKMVGFSAILSTEMQLPEGVTVASVVTYCCWCFLLLMALLLLLTLLLTWLDVAGFR